MSVLPLGLPPMSQSRGSSFSDVPPVNPVASSKPSDTCCPVLAQSWPPASTQVSPSISKPPGCESPGPAGRQLTVSAAIAKAPKVLKPVASDGPALPTVPADLPLAAEVGFLVVALLVLVELLVVVDPSELGPSEPAPAAPAA